MRINIDTDAIIPSREMKRVSKSGLDEGLFAGWRYTLPGGREPNPDFVLNKPEYNDAKIILAGDNFGCGSSREHAVWALKEYGIRAIVAPGFGTIFAGNCVRNGLLPLVLPAEVIAAIAAWVSAAPGQNRVLIDLQAQQLEAVGQTYSFEIDTGDRRMLLQGLDAIALTQTRGEIIEQFHRRRQKLRPWLY